MVIELKNDTIKLALKRQGAEICSLKTVENETEYIWQADPAVWKRHAPVLFPVVGRLVNDRYTIGGESYQMSQHGFARDMDFEIESQNDNAITFSLCDNEKTRILYPFRFRLLIQYELKEKTVNVTYRVENSDDRRIWFSIGGHPAFNCPLKTGEQISDYFLEFEKEESRERFFLEGGLISGETSSFLNNERVFQLSPDLFDRDAVIIKNPTSSSVSLKSGNHEVGVKLTFPDFPYLGIWSKSGEAGFICLEPWFGITDPVGFSGEFKDKEGIQKLDQSESFESHFSITVT